MKQLGRLLFLPALLAASTASGDSIPPAISSVTPSGITVDHSENSIIYVIEGSNFGQSDSDSRLEYVGVNFSEYVTAWDDTTITVEITELTERQIINIDSIDDLRFTVITPHGEAHSEPAAPVKAFLFTVTEEDGKRFTDHTEVMRGLYTHGLRLDLVPRNGVIRSGSPEGPVTTEHISGSETALYGVPSEQLPMLVSMSLDGTHLGTYVVNNPGAVVLAEEFTHTPDQASETKMQIGFAAGSPDFFEEFIVDYYSDDGLFTYSFSGYPIAGSHCPAIKETAPAPLAPDAAGFATIAVPALPGAPGHDSYCPVLIQVHYDGVYLADTFFVLAHTAAE